MAALLPTTRYITALGPIKMEIVRFAGTVTTTTGTTQTGVTSADTFTTLIQNPNFAICVNDGDTVNTSWVTSFSGKTATMTNSGVSNANGINLLVFGF
jgi:hypothetical protein